jgi:hypothetical protein
MDAVKKHPACSIACWWISQPENEDPASDPLPYLAVPKRQPWNRHAAERFAQESAQVETSLNPDAPTFKDCLRGIYSPRLPNNHGIPAFAAA